MYSWMIWVDHAKRHAKVESRPKPCVDCLIRQGPKGHYSMYVGWGEYEHSNNREVLEDIRKGWGVTKEDVFWCYLSYMLTDYPAWLMHRLRKWLGV